MFYFHRKSVNMKLSLKRKAPIIENTYNLLCSSQLHVLVSLLLATYMPSTFLFRYKIEHSRDNRLHYVANQDSQ